MLVFRYGAALLVSFFYYLGLILFFDYKRAFITVPFSWLLNWMKVDIPETLAPVISALLAALFVFAGTLGLFFLKQLKGRATAKLWIVFFLLLPLCLRF